MDKEDLLLNFTEEFAYQGRFYSYTHIPPQIGQSIYLFGDQNIFDVFAYFDASENQDGIMGLILTMDTLYFQFKNKGIIQYKDIEELTLEKHYQDDCVKIYIKTNQMTYLFRNTYMNVEELIHFLSEITDLTIQLRMSETEKIAYYSHMVINDIANDVYEDVELSSEQLKELSDITIEMTMIENMKVEEYEYEYKLLLPRILTFIEELELDSEEIDQLFLLHDDIRHREDIELQQAQDYYQDMMNKLNQGDSSMMKQMKSAMNTLGIDEEELKNKSPEELDQYLEDLCLRFGVSKQQIDTLRKKMSN